WVDIEGRLLHRLRPETGRIDVWTMPERIASFALREQGGLVVAFASGLAFLDLDTGRVDWLCKPEAHLPHNRFNEGKADRRGRFWIGSMDDKLTASTGSLYRLDTDLSLTTVIDGGIGISNCMVWSLENDRFWFADTLKKQVSVFDYDHVTGNLSNRAPFVDTTGQEYGPDGGTIDEDGFLWIAMWGGSKVSRFAPDGCLDRDIHLPVSKPSSCMFGGPDLCTLYVTSAIWDSSPEELRQRPQTGGLFAIDAGVRGVPEPRFAG
ncbi:MAG: SMP-30/gluconolactonase/LRE family protein, partial [Rhizobiaceae bacterium]|nr:SMP-30/gluconolactonase/LRE family protein [Rhizobiaceae bacterium]